MTSGHLILPAKPAKIGLISDTHIPLAADALPAGVMRAFEGVDLILHAGDIYSLSVLDELERLAPVVAAQGNGDFGLDNDPRVRPVHVLHLDGLVVGLVHSLPYPWMPAAPIFGQRVDVVVCGNTHVPAIQRIGRVLVANPGSPTLPHNIVGVPGTVAVLRLDRGDVEATIIPLS